MAEGSDGLREPGDRRAPAERGVEQKNRRHAHTLARTVLRVRPRVPSGAMSEYRAAAAPWRGLDIIGVRCTVGDHLDLFAR